jgi:hypothetical protein
MRITVALLAALSCATLDCAAGQARGTLTVSATLLAPTCLEAPDYKDCIPHVETRRSVTSHSVAVPGGEPGAPSATRLVGGAATIVTITY